MNASDVLLAVAILCAGWGVVSAIVIADTLQKRGVKVNWFMLRLLMPRYIGQYRDMTRSEKGRPGTWYYSFLTAMNLALATAAVGLILRVI